MDDKTMLYLVRFDGYLMGYGSENYLLGVYSTRKKAEEAVEKFKENLKEKLDASSDLLIYTEGIQLDHTYQWKIDPDWGVEAQVYLGGYIE